MEFIIVLLPITGLVSIIQFLFAPQIKSALKWLKSSIVQRVHVSNENF